MAQDRDAHRPGKEPQREPPAAAPASKLPGVGEAPDQARGEGDGDHDRRPDQEPDLLRGLPRSPCAGERRAPRFPAPNAGSIRNQPIPPASLTSCTTRGVRDRVAEKRQILGRRQQPSEPEEQLGGDADPQRRPPPPRREPPGREEQRRDGARARSSPPATTADPAEPALGRAARRRSASRWRTPGRRRRAPSHEVAHSNQPIAFRGSRATMSAPSGSSGSRRHELSSWLPSPDGRPQAHRSRRQAAVSATRAAGAPLPRRRSRRDADARQVGGERAALAWRPSIATGVAFIRRAPIPASRALTIACARSTTWIFVKTLETWLRIVLIERPSCAAICWFDHPRATRSRISCSRAVRSGNGVADAAEAAASKKPIMRRAIAGPNTAPPSATVRSARSSSACRAPLTR